MILPTYRYTTVLTSEPQIQLRSVAHVVNASGAYVQMLPMTDPENAWQDFLSSRQQALMESQNVIDPMLLPQLFPDDFPTNASSSSP